MLIQFEQASAIGAVAFAAASVLKLAIMEPKKDAWWKLIVLALVFVALYLLLHGDVMHALGHFAPAPTAPSSARIEALPARVSAPVPHSS